MTTDPLSFLDEEQKQQAPQQSSDPLDFLEKSTPSWRDRKFAKPHEKTPFVRVKKGRNILADVVTTATSFAGLPGDIASIAIGENPLTSEKLREKAFEFLPSLAPKSEEEKKWDEGLSTVMGLATPGGLIKAPVKLLGKGLGKIAPKALKGGLKGKYHELYELGRNLGISEKALAPFRHGKVSEFFLKHISKLGKEAQEGIQFAEKLASPKYDQLFAQGAQIPVNQISKRSVVRGLEGIVQDIKKSPALVNESKDVIKFLEEAVHGIKSNPNFNVENLMSLQKQLGKTVNWKSIKQAGKGHLIKQSQDAVMKGIYGMNPALGKSFSDMDKLYKGYKTLAKEVAPNKMLQFASKGGPVGYALISLMTGHDFTEAATTAATLHFGKKGLAKISAKLLTDPKWVGIKEKIIKTIKNESYDKIPKLLVALKKKAEMHPEKENEED